jgi:hypothetical protein
LAWTAAAKMSSGRQASTTSDIFQPLVKATIRPAPKVTRFCGGEAGFG